MKKIKQMIEKAKVAQAIWGKADQAKIDKVVRGIGKTVFDNAELLARLTVNETKIGNYEDNLNQDKRKAEIIWLSLKGKKSVGIIKRDEETGIVEIAKPVGVVGIILPVTIPVTNFMSNAMFSLKCGNAAIFAPHPRAKKTIATIAKLTLKAMKKLNVPENLIQYIEKPSIELTKELMSAVDLVVATGGMGIVKAAYSSGRPAYGVGPGNVQCIIDKNVDIDDAVEKIIIGRSYNYGLPCACEQAIIAPKEDFEKIISSFIKNKAVYIERRDAIEKLFKILFTDEVLTKDCVGISAYDIAKKAGLSIPKGTKIILIKGDLKEQDKAFRKEKLCPVSIIYAYDKFEEAINIAKSNLEIEGKGHSVAIHSNNKKHIEQFALSVDVSRVVVNQACTTTAGGSFTIGFAPTTTLGCGTWGNNIISENLTYKHLMNITRIGFPMPNNKMPSREEIWE